VGTRLWCECIAIAERILCATGSRRHSSAELKPDSVAAGNCKRIDVVEHQVFNVRVGRLSAEKCGVQHLLGRGCELPAARSDRGSQALLPLGPASEADVVIGPDLD